MKAMYYSFSGTFLCLNAPYQHYTNAIKDLGLLSCYLGLSWGNGVEKTHLTAGPTSCVHVAWTHDSCAHFENFWYFFEIFWCFHRIFIVFSSYFHRHFIVISSSFHRHFIVISSSFHRHFIIISSSFHRHFIVISSSFHPQARPGLAWPGLAWPGQA